MEKENDLKILSILICIIVLLFIVITLMFSKNSFYLGNLNSNEFSKFFEKANQEQTKEILKKYKSEEEINKIIDEIQ